jgi:16S rRNA processing protein RimM
MREQQTFLAVGRIVGAHGVRGEVKVKLLTDFPERFVAGAYFFIENEKQPREVVAVRPHKGLLLIRFAGIDNRNKTESLLKKYLFIPRDEAAPLGEDEYYEDELLGLQVETVAGQLLGELVEIIWTGANEVYVVKGAQGEILLPAIADVVQSVDLDNGIMRVTLLPGLIA